MQFGAAAQPPVLYGQPAPPQPAASQGTGQVTPPKYQNHIFFLVNNSLSLSLQDKKRLLWQSRSELTRWLFAQSMQAPGYGAPAGHGQYVPQQMTRPSSLQQPTQPLHGVLSLSLSLSKPFRSTASFAPQSFLAKYGPIKYLCFLSLYHHGNKKSGASEDSSEIRSHNRGRFVPLTHTHTT